MSDYSCTSIVKPFLFHLKSKEYSCYKFNYIRDIRILEIKIQRNAVHGCYYGQREAKLLSGSWHQLLSIPIFVIPVSSPLFKTSSGFSNKTTKWFWQQDNSVPQCKLQYLLLVLIMVITFHNFMKFYTIMCMLCSFLCFHCLRRKLRSIGRNWGTVIHINNMLVSIQRLAWRLLEQIQNVSYLTQIHLPYQLPHVGVFLFLKLMPTRCVSALNYISTWNL